MVGAKWEKSLTGSGFSKHLYMANGGSSSGSRIWSRGAPALVRSILPTTLRYVGQAKRAYLGMGFGAHLRAPEAFGVSWLNMYSPSFPGNF